MFIIIETKDGRYYQIEDPELTVDDIAGCYVSDEDQADPVTNH